VVRHKTRTELNFVDSYASNIAAYRVAGLIGLDAMIPMTAQREYEHEKGRSSAGWTRRWTRAIAETFDRLIAQRGAVRVLF
jgi:hypothetical protein